MAYKDKDKQKAAVRESVRRHRAKQKGITYCPSVLPDELPKVIPVIPKQDSTDSIPEEMQEHLQKLEPMTERLMSESTDQEILDSWADGNGTPWQQSMGVLARQYDVIHGYRDKQGGLTAAGYRYLGQ